MFHKSYGNGLLMIIRVYFTLEYIIYEEIDCNNTFSITIYPLRVGILFHLS